MKSSIWHETDNVMGASLNVLFITQSRDRVSANSDMVISLLHNVFLPHSLNLFRTLLYCLYKANIQKSCTFVLNSDIEDFFLD